VGCALVGGLFDILRLEQIDECLCFPACAVALQGERVRVCAIFRVMLCLVVSPIALSALNSLLHRIIVLSCVMLIWLCESPRCLDECY